ncbi:MAG: GGDEF domain-containing protein [Candidatus Krumholzibacteria bacterium]|nr:GGDEF domain-containing protein [Candidatus Krumholzibacteria bacterium]
MRIFERDYRYLLQNLVPQHRLPPDLRRDVDAALAGGDAAALRALSVRALEALCDESFFERADVRGENGQMVLAYRRKGGRFQVSVALPRVEWEGMADAWRAGRAPEPPRSDEGQRAPAEAPAPPPERPAEPSSAPPDEAAGEAVSFLPDIIRSFAMTERTDPVLARLENLLDTLHRWMGLRGATLDVVDEAVSRSESPGPRVRVLGENVLRDSDLLRGVIETGAQRLVPKAEIDDTPRGAEVGWGVLGVAPIFSMGKVQGVLRVFFPAALEPATMATRLKVAASAARQVIEFHHQIEDLTSIDALTGLYNRHFFDSQVAVEIERATRSGGVVSMLMIDVDDFKRVNDELGHRKGDEALSLIAALVRKNLRKVDMPFRYGGEEIVILLPGTSEFESVHTAERLRRVIAQHGDLRDAHGRPRRITVSVGVSVFPVTAKSAEELFAQADGAMYRAKALGKNRVVLYKEGMEPDRA